MAFDATLAERVRDLCTGDASVTERRMFGGLAFLTDGHLFAGIVGRDLMLRAGEAALDRPHARPMDFTGRPLSGMVFVSPEGCESDADLAAWVALARRYVAANPPKKRR